MGRRVMNTETVAERLRRGLRGAAPKDRPRRDDPPPQEPPPAVETFTAADLMQMDLPEQRWAVHDVLPDGCTVFGGKSKIGKSWLAYNVALAVAQGGVALGTIPVEAGDVLYLSLEDTKRRLKERLAVLLSKQHGAAPERLTLVNSCPRADKGGLAFIDDWLNKHKQARLIILDTWAKFKRARVVRTNEYDADYADASEVKAMADQHGVAVLLVHHCRKMPASDPMEEVLGSMGLTGAVDSILVLRRDRGQHDAALHVMGRDVEEQELALRWTPEYGLWEIMGDAEEHRVSAERQQLIDLLAGAGKPMKPSEIAPLLEKSLNATKVLLHRAWQAGKVKKLGDGWYTVEMHTESNHGNPSNHSNSSNQSNSATVTVSYSGNAGQSNPPHDSHVVFPD
jgi:hypothetical protein